MAVSSIGVDIHQARVPLMMYHFCFSQVDSQHVFTKHYTGKTVGQCAEKCTDLCMAKQTDRQTLVTIYNGYVNNFVVDIGMYDVTILCVGGLPVPELSRRRR